jgi:hypothetical protein
MLTGDWDHIGCFTDQVKLTRAFVRDLDEAIKVVKLLGEQEEGSSRDSRSSPLHWITTVAGSWVSAVNRLGFGHSG